MYEHGLSYCGMGVWRYLESMRQVHAFFMSFKHNFLIKQNGDRNQMYKKIIDIVRKHSTLILILHNFIIFVPKFFILSKKIVFK